MLIIEQNRLMNTLLSGIPAKVHEKAATLGTGRNNDVLRAALKQLAQPKQPVVQRLWNDGRSWADEARAHRKLFKRERNKLAAGHWSGDMMKLAHHHESGLACIWLHWFEQLRRSIDTLTPDQADRAFQCVAAMIERAQAAGVPRDHLVLPRRVGLALYDIWLGDKFEDAAPAWLEAAQ